MTEKEAKLIDILIPLGTPTNICVTDTMLTFDLKDPHGGCKADDVFVIQRTIFQAFPEYKYINKMVNDETHFWAVLVTKKQKA